MTLMTSKLAAELEAIRHARHGLRKDLAEYIDRTVNLVRRYPETFGSRAELTRYVYTLKKLITTEVNCG